jgi:hypothetical protein
MKSASSDKLFSMDDQKPEQSPLKLDYGLAKYPKNPASRSYLGDFTAGFFFWVAAAFCTGGLMFILNPIVPYQILVTTVPALGVVAVIGVSFYSHSKLGKRGFIPGVLIGLGLTCLVPVGILAVVCGHP